MLLSGRIIDGGYCREPKIKNNDDIDLDPDSSLDIVLNGDKSVKSTSSRSPTLAVVLLTLDNYIIYTYDMSNS